MFDVETVRADFPILSREVNGKPLIYLDSGASAQKPQVVIDAITRAYAEEYANVHRGLHYLSNLATDKYEAVRGKLARFLNAASEEHIVLNSGTTEGINLVAYGWAMPRFEAGDEIVLSIMEHHANIIPWHFLRERQGVVHHADAWTYNPGSTGLFGMSAMVDADKFTAAREAMLAATHTDWAPWTLVDFNDQKRGRLTLVRNLLDRLPETKVEPTAIDLPPLGHPPADERYGELKPITSYAP